MFGLRPKQASIIWLEPHYLHVGEQSASVNGIPDEAKLTPLLSALPASPTKWIVDDLWAPSVLLRDIVELPANVDARDEFFKWKFSQALSIETPFFVQQLPLGDGSWLLTGMEQAFRDRCMQLSLKLARPIHALVPRWLWIYNRLAPVLDMPGMLLSLSGSSHTGFTGTLLAWGRQIALIRQWSDPASPKIWMEERVLPSAAFLQREGRTPQTLWVWGTLDWPEGPFPVTTLQPEIPVQELL